MGELLTPDVEDGDAGRIALEAWGLHKAYGDRTVVDVEHLRVEEGAVFALLGPNGAGKSTLFRLLALLERPDAGRIVYSGREVGMRDLEARRRMATVFQRPVFFAGTVWDNVRYGLRLRGERGRGADDKVRRTLELLAMDDFGKADVRTLSGGELQRAALARALVLDPWMLFLDEPTSNLDPGVRRVLREDLRDIVRRMGMTVVLITHDQNEAFNLAQRIAIVSEGRIVQEGTPDEVFNRPGDAFVAEFMGLETIWPGRVERCTAGLCLVRTDAGLLAEVPAEASPGERLSLTMRPEDVVLVSTEDGGGPQTSVRNRWPGRVESLSHAGPLVRVRLLMNPGAREAGGQDGDPRAGFLVALVTRASAEALVLVPGREIEAQVKASALHVLKG